MLYNARKEEVPLNTLNVGLAGERSTSQKVAEILRSAIFRGELALGARLVEANVAKSLNVSITPVRQAFAQLATEGLIQVVPYKGTNVVNITEPLIEEVYGVRLRLELMAAELALPYMTEADCGLLEEYARRMDRNATEGDFEGFAALDIQFHALFYERSGHSLLLELWKSIQSRIRLLQTYGRSFNRPAEPGEVEGRHLPIVSAVRRGDLPSLLELTEAHIRMGKAMLSAHRAEPH